MLDELRERILERRISPPAVQKFADYLTEEFQNFEYYPFLKDCWSDITRLVDAVPEPTLVIFKDWLKTMESKDVYSVLTSSLWLRLRILQVLFEDTFEVFLEKAAREQLKSHIIEEIERLLLRLEENQDSHMLERLRDRFSFLQMTIRRLEEMELGS